VVIVFVAVLATALLLVAGFAYDGGQLLRAFNRANDLADAAARAGAQGIDTEQFRASGSVTLDAGDAQARAQAFLAESGHPGIGSVSVSGDQVTVTVTLPYDPRILPGTRSVSATSTATAVEGVDGESIGGS
jgi:Flp pilus assembly protein TadG